MRGAKVSLMCRQVRDFSTSGCRVSCNDPEVKFRTRPSGVAFAGALVAAKLKSCRRRTRKWQSRWRPGMDDNHSGSCLCGAVRFKTRGPLRGVIYCHCSQCRKQSGHFYAATNVADENITIAGTDKHHLVRSVFVCQTRLLQDMRLGAVLEAGQDAYISVLAGLFDEPDRARGRMPHLRRRQGRLLHDRRRAAAVREVDAVDQGRGRVIFGAAALFP